MTIVNFEWHVRTGYRDLMREPGVAAAMQDILIRVQQRAGDGFETDLDAESGYRNVPRGSVRTATRAARVRQAKEHVLEKALDI